MVLAATLASGALFHFDIALQPILIRRALIWRAISFTMMLLGGYYSSLWLVLGGGFTSGIFVGIFWPTYYRIQKICQMDFSKWNLRDKLAGALIVGISGFLVESLGVEIVLLLSLVSIIISAEYSKDLTVDEGCEQIFTNTSDFPLRIFSSNPSLIAMVEGAFNWMTNLTRLLVLITGLLQVVNLPGAIGLGLLLAITQTIGAGVTCGVKEWKGESKKLDYKLLTLGLFISLFSSILLVNKLTWLAGMILLSVGTAIIFPLLKDEVDQKLDRIGTGGRGLREYSRNIGRTIGSLITASIWVTIPELYALALPIIISVIIITYLCIYSISDISIN
tara:strand:+ start:4545 stop:5546 length:1002 start_codon:yes stop_codon:yes gene_type:complete